MTLMKTVAAGLMLGALASTVVCAQNGNTLDDGTYAHSTPFPAAYTAAPRRARSSKRDATAAMKKSAMRKKAERQIEIKSICIGCGAK